MAAPNNGVCILNDVIEVQCIGKLYGDYNMIVLNFKIKFTDLFVNGPRQHLQNLMAAMASNITVNQTWMKFRWRRMVPLPVTEYLEYTWAGTNGANAGPALPAQVCSVWQIRTSLDAPAGKGRFYLPGVPLAFWNGDRYTTAARQVHDGLRAQIRDGFGFNGNSDYLMLGVRSRQGAGTAWNAMHDVEALSYPGIQRSRRPEIFGA